MAKKIKIDLSSKASIRRGFKQWEKEINRAVEKEVKKVEGKLKRGL